MKKQDPQNSPQDATDPKDGVSTAQTPNDAADAKPDPQAQSKYIQRVAKANSRLHKFQSKVAMAEADVEQAKGVLKKAIGDRDGAVIELQKVIEGQQTLPGMEDANDPIEAVSVVGDFTVWPISELGSKQLAKIVGKEVVEACKSRGEPIGLTDKVLEKLESADIATIFDLEKQMREKFAWYEILAKSADAEIVTRVVNSLNEFRRVHPQGETQPKKTIVESLAEKNEQANATEAAVA